MLKLRKSLIVCLFSFVFFAHAQDQTAKLDSLIASYYPNSDDPGIVLLISDVGKGAIYSNAQGVAKLEDSSSLSLTSNFRMASVSKQFTAYAIYQLFKEGKLKLTDPIGKFLPSLKGTAATIKISELLNHTSGIKDYENIIPEQQKEQLSDADVLQLVSPYTDAFTEDNRRFKYSNTAYCLLSLIVERVSGQVYTDYMKTQVFDPLGMVHTQIFEQEARIANRAFGYTRRDKNFVFADQSITSATIGDGGVYCSPVDYQIWATHVMQLAMSNTDYGKDLLRQETASNVSKDVDYSLGWFVIDNNAGRTCLLHSGESTGFHNIVLLIPEEGESISLFTNRDDMQISSFFDQVLKVLDIQLKGMNGKEVFRWLSDAYADKH
ncbi:serine hydrolase domain-containing protein [Sphingobacterium hotanense]|uniref:serine hydrolase domain-containing protein n=1 Tax=Sphingobacterium hotanense TaxID=649196 RepID=UPI0021A4AFD2|nr:serine hydrolase domain-containing protein [Sphingobacterium hotanense]MCT1525135.1 beta-lactamase family protein [Sphingobacterium hotanense]